MSPCINICKLNEDKVCIGCYRTIKEIAGWSKLTLEQKQQVLEVVKKRKYDYMGNISKQS